MEKSRRNKGKLLTVNGLECLLAYTLAYAGARQRQPDYIERCQRLKRFLKATALMKMRITYDIAFKYLEKSLGNLLVLHFDDHVAAIDQLRTVDLEERWIRRPVSRCSEFRLEDKSTWTLRRRVILPILSEEKLLRHISFSWVTGSVVESVESVILMCRGYRDQNYEIFVTSIHCFNFPTLQYQT